MLGGLNVKNSKRSCVVAWVLLLKFLCQVPGALAWTAVENTIHACPIQQIRCIAYLSQKSCYRSLLEEKLGRINSNVIDEKFPFGIQIHNKGQKSVDFSLLRSNSMEAWNPEENFALYNFLSNLPVDRMSLLLPMSLDRTQDGQWNPGSEDTWDLAVSDFMAVWDVLHNSVTRLQFHSSGERLSIYSVTRPAFLVRHPLKSSRRRTGRRRSNGKDTDTNRKVEDEIYAVVQSRIQSNPLFRSNDESTTDNLVLNVSFDEVDENCTSLQVLLELPVLTRIYPLRNGVAFQSSSPTEQDTRLSSRKRRRLESYVVARTADIQPGEVVLDPFCQRGTILIEAAKHWPSAAAFLGLASDLGDLEHARMNSDSTYTSLKLYFCPRGNPLKTSVFSLWRGSIDKITTCMPFGRSAQFYRACMLEFSNLLKKTGMLVLAMDSLALHHVRNALEDGSLNLAATFVRQPTIPWGAERVHIVVIRSADRHKPLMQGILPWETSTNFEDAANDRLKTIPSMVTLPIASKAHRSANKIWMPSGKVYRNSY